MTETPEGKQPVESPDEESAVFVVDPDDYGKAKKIQAINDAKRYVRKIRQNDPEVASPKEWDSRYARLAEAVAFYGSELWPLIEDALERGALDYNEYLIADGGELSVELFIRKDGSIERDERHRPASREESMKVYRQLERVQQELGLGLELEEDKGPVRI
jgi:hypothetical protein